MGGVTHSAGPFCATLTSFLAPALTFSDCETKEIKASSHLILVAGMRLLLAAFTTDCGGVPFLAL